MTTLKWIIEICFLLSFYKDCLGLKNVKLTIEPPIVARYQHAILYCTYDLQDSALYTVKWYRGASEFYRYTATDYEKTKVFSFPGINVDVDRSNSTQVYLRNITDFRLEGNFTCEVNTEDVPVLSGSDTQYMQIVQLPDTEPKISVESEPFDYGDILRANCSSPPSKPQAILKMSLNNVRIATTDILTQKTSSGPTWSDLMAVVTLSEFHFQEGRLILSCVAQVSDIYKKESVLELASARHPVPERVSSAFNAASSLPTNVVIHLITFNWLFLINS